MGIPQDFEIVRLTQPTGELNSRRFTDIDTNRNMDTWVSDNELDEIAQVLNQGFSGCKLQSRSNKDKMLDVFLCSSTCDPSRYGRR